MLHRIGRPQQEDTCILEERSPEHHLHVDRTKDWAFLTLNSNSKASSEVRHPTLSCPTQIGARFSVCAHVLLTRHAHQLCMQCRKWMYVMAPAPLQVHLLDARCPGGAGLVCVEPRRPGLEYFVEHSAGRLYIMTNAASEEYSLMTTAAHEPQMRCNRSLFRAHLQAGTSQQQCRVHHGAV